MGGCGWGGGVAGGGGVLALSSNIPLNSKCLPHLKVTYIHGRKTSLCPSADLDNWV